VELGDRVTARVVVSLDPHVVRPETLRVADSLAPLTALGPTRVTRASSGDLAVVTYATPAACLSDSCLEGTIPPKTVAATSARRGGGTLRATTQRPALEVGGRVTARDAARDATALRDDRSPPPVSYRISPSWLALVLDVLAVVLAVAGVGLGA